MSEEFLSRRSRTLFGILGAGALGVTAGVMAISATPSEAGSTYYSASFARAGQGLDEGKSDVKIRGIRVGNVESITLSEDGRVDVRMRMDRGVRVPVTTSATVEPLSVFGPKDIALDLGRGERAGPYLSDGGRIARTVDPQELADTAWPAHRLTQAIDPEQVGTILRTFGAGLNGQGPALRDTVTNLTTVVDGTWRNRAVLHGLINDVGGLGATLGSRGDTIGRAVTDLNRVAPVISDEPDKIAQLLDRTAGVAGVVGTTMTTHGDKIGGLVDSAGRILRVASAEQHNIPVLIDGLNGFFNLLAGIIQQPGPQNTELAQISATLPLDICRILADLCSDPGPNPTDQKARRP